MRTRRRAVPVRYTIRGVPPEVDSALRKEARRSRSSLNQAALAALRRGLGLRMNDGAKNDLGRFAGTWVEDPGFDEMMKAFE